VIASSVDAFYFSQRIEEQYEWNGVHHVSRTGPCRRLQGFYRDAGLGSAPKLALLLLQASERKHMSVT